MRIELQEPYASRYSKGYLRRDQKGRGRVDLVNNATDRTTVAYARYLLEVSMCSFIPSGYEVDHIDSDCSNDSLDNLQILTIEDHLIKSAKEREGRTYIEFVCPYCGVLFQREVRQVTTSQKNVFCSRSCNARYSIGRTCKINNHVHEDDIHKIRELAKEGMSGYRISKLTGISGNTVRKYMKGFTPIPEQASTL